MKDQPIGMRILAIIIALLLMIGAGAAWYYWGVGAYFAGLIAVIALGVLLYALGIYE